MQQLKSVQELLEDEDEEGYQVSVYLRKTLLGSKRLAINRFLNLFIP